MPPGYCMDTPPWPAFWLLIIVDNAVQLYTSYDALRWLLIERVISLDRSR
jgi:hypothetical protein